MADDNKTQNPAVDPEKIEKLEFDLKDAFKEEDFEKARKIADEVKKLDPENHIAQRISEKMEEAEADKLREANTDKIKVLELQVKQAFKVGNLPEIEKSSEEIKKVDPANKVVRKIETKITKARAALEKQENKEKVNSMTDELKRLMEEEKWSRVEEKANEILKLDKKNNFALKALKKVDEAKPKSAIDTAKTAEVHPKGKEVKKPGLFARLFGKKKAPEKKEGVISSKEKKPALEVKPKEPSPAPEVKPAPAPIPVKPPVPVAEAPKPESVKPPTPVVEVPKVTAPATTPVTLAPAIQTETQKPATAPVAETPKPAEPVPAGMHAAAPPKPVTPAKELKPAEPMSKTEKKPGFFAKLFKKKAEDKPKEAVRAPAQVKKPDPEQVKKEKIKDIEGELKHALKDKHEPEVKRLMDEIAKLDPKNKAIKKAQDTLDKEKTALEAKIKKEKVKGLTGEIKEALKDSDWKKAEDKANELLKADKKNSFASKALKKVADAKKAKEAKPAVSAKAKKPGFFTRLFGKKKPSSPKLSLDKAAKALDTKVVEKPEEAKKPEVKKTPVLAEPVTIKAEPVMPKAEPPKSVTPKVEPPKPATQPTAFTPPPKPIISIPQKPAAPAPATPQIKAEKPIEKPESKTPVVAVPLADAAKKVAPVPAKPAGKSEAGKGNIFTKLFGEKETAKTGAEEKPSKSIIDTIVEKTEKGKEAEKKARKPEDVTGEGLLRFATVFLEFSVAFILISAGFFYVQNIDEENRVLSLFKIEENNASRLHSAAQELEGKEEEEKKLNKEIEGYKKGEEDKNEETVQKLIEGRLDWPDLIKKLNEVTESIYEKNALSQYVQYNNYSYDVEKGLLGVSATLSDPLGKNLTKLAEIEVAFRTYPDKDAPYFYGLQEFNSFSKSFDTATGRYKSSFSLKLSTKPLEKK